jgi:hypothetical protein
MKYTSIAFFLFFSMYLNGQGYHGLSDFEPTEVKKYKYKKNIKNFKNLTNYIKEKKFDNLDDLINRVKNAVIDKKHDTLEFGVIRYNIWQRGGYRSNNIKLCTFENRILSFEIIIGWDHLDLLQFVSKKDSSLIGLIDNYWVKEEIFTHEDYLTFEYENPILMKKYKKIVEKELGVLKEIITDSLTQKIYLSMINPLKDYDYNYYGFSKITKESYQDSTWHKLGNIDIIKNVMKGYNYVGRIFAVEKLLTLSKNNQYTLTEEDRVLIKKISQMNIKIVWWEGGDLGRAGTIKELFEKKKLSELMKANGFD